MQIQNIQNKNYYYNKLNNNYYDNTKIKNKTPINNYNGVIYNTNIKFSGLNKEYFIKLLTKDPIKEFKGFTKEEYLKLTESQKKRLREEYKKVEQKDPYLFESMGEIHSYIASCMKNTFDKRFGKNNYVILPIGRSLSTISKALEIKLGSENVVNIPFSDARRYYSFNPSKDFYRYKINELKKDKGLKNFINFLESKKLGKKEVSNSNKHYILLDYCVSGFSLEGAEELFKSDLVWGNKNQNIHTVNFMKFLNAFDENTINPPIKHHPLNISIHSKLENILYEEEYKPYATIGKARKLADTTKASEEVLKSISLSRDTKLVWFNLIDKIMTGVKNYQVKHKTPIEIKKTNIKNQIVELWEDSHSKYKNDLKNDLNKISKLLIQLETDKILDENELSQIINSYKYLFSCFKNINDNQQKIDYYKNRNNIIKILDNINSKLTE